MSGAWTGAGTVSSSASGDWQERVLALNVPVAGPRREKGRDELLWVGAKVRGPPGLTPQPHPHPLTREAGPGRRPGAGLNEKLLTLMLHQMHVLTDLLERHLWGRAGQHCGRLASVRAQGPEQREVAVDRCGGHGVWEKKKAEEWGSDPLHLPTPILRAPGEARPGGELEDGHSPAQGAQAPRHHPRCCHWRSQD